MSGVWGHTGLLMFKARGSAKDSAFGGYEFWVWAIVEIDLPSLKPSWNAPSVCGNLIYI